MNTAVIYLYFIAWFILSSYSNWRLSLTLVVSVLEKVEMANVSLAIT